MLHETYITFHKPTKIVYDPVWGVGHENDEDVIPNVSSSQTPLSSDEPLKDLFVVEMSDVLKRSEIECFIMNHYRGVRVLKASDTGFPTGLDLMQYCSRIKNVISTCEGQVVLLASPALCHAYARSRGLALCGENDRTFLHLIPESRVCLEVDFEFSNETARRTYNYMHDVLPRCDYVLHLTKHGHKTAGGHDVLKKLCNDVFYMKQRFSPCSFCSGSNHKDTWCVSSVLPMSHSDWEVHKRLSFRTRYPHKSSKIAKKEEDGQKKQTFEPAIESYFQRPLSKTSFLDYLQVGLTGRHGGESKARWLKKP